MNQSPAHQYSCDVIHCDHSDQSDHPGKIVRFLAKGSNHIGEAIRSLLPTRLFHGRIIIWSTTIMIINSLKLKKSYS